MVGIREMFNEEAKAKFRSLRRRALKGHFSPNSRRNYMAFLSNIEKYQNLRRSHAINGIYDDRFIKGYYSPKKLSPKGGYIRGRAGQRWQRS